MTELQRATPASGQLNGGEGTNQKGQGQYNPTEQKLCSGYGQYHSPTAKKNPRPLVTVTLSDIEAMAAEPPSVAKDSAQWVIPSTLLTRKHAEQHANGEFWALWGDVDEANGLAFTELVETASGLIPGGFIAYTSRSATEANQKARLIVPLSEPVSGGVWLALQKILNDKLEAAGVTPDRVTERTGQPCYLPNRGEFYSYHVEASEWMGMMNPDRWADELVEEAERQHAEEETRKAKAKPAKDYSKAVEVPPGGIHPSDYFLSNYRARDLLDSAGAIFVSEAKFYSPGRDKDGNPGGIYDPETDRFITYHEKDPFCDGQWHGAIDLLMHLEGIDFRSPDAFIKLCRTIETEPGVSIELHNQRAFREAESAPKADINALFNNPEEPEPKPPSRASVDLLNPPGLAGVICKYMNMTARRPRPELYPFAALHLMALIGRKRQNVFGAKHNLMTLAIAPTAAGKEKAQDTVKRLAKEHYCSNLVFGNAGSFKDLIYNLLEGDGASLYIVDEVHSLLGSMKDKNAATYEKKMEADILTMNSTELYTFRGIEKRSLMDIYQKQASQLEKALDEAGDDTEKAEKLERALAKAQRRVDWLENGLPDPFFSLMGHSVPERLDSFIRVDNIASGFLGRTLVTRCPDTRAKLRRTPVDEGEQALCEFTIDEGLQRIRRSGTTIAANDEAADYLEACIDWYEADEQLNHHIAGGIYARAPEHLFRVASILALEEGTITLEHARYADALVKQSIDDVSYILLKAYSEGDGAQERGVMEHARQTVHRNCKAPGLPESRLKQLVTKPKGWADLQNKDKTRDRFRELVESMVAAGELEKVTDGRKERYLSRAVV
ncbi:hypothetical protein [Marinobacter sp.]|uniref:hypothetical protein n=1 Tax=Marinobacter sp. TaxID=50741 RepID=UPI0019A92555|nr:hypothetical protein [Marinobacter sp.]MBD3655511.1 hypothetical protein [Marinobacter sp.]